MNVPAAAATCTDCPRTLHKPCPTMRCRSCNAKRLAADRDVRAKAGATMRALFADPAVRARRGAATSRAIAEKRRTDPAFVAMQRETGRRLAATGLGARALGPAGSEGRMRAGRGISAAKLAWCPPDYRAEYIRLLRSKLLKKPDARRIILEQAAKDGALVDDTPPLPWWKPNAAADGSRRLATAVKRALARPPARTAASPSDERTHYA